MYQRQHKNEGTRVNRTVQNELEVQTSTAYWSDETNSHDRDKRQDLKRRTGTDSTRCLLHKHITTSSIKKTCFHHLFSVYNHIYENAYLLK